MAKESGPLRLLLVVAAAATAWSAVGTADYATWFFELFIGAAGVAALAMTHRRFRFSAVVYVVAAVHYVILAAGAKYTYAEMPLFDWLKDVLHLSRNHFDRVGHFFQGVTPALLVRELLLRRGGMRRGASANALAVSVALAFSGAYEIFEWLWVAAFYPGRGPEWLGMQGDAWDAQADMLMAFCGGLTSVLLLSSFQDSSGSLPQPR